MSGAGYAGICIGEQHRRAIGVENAQGDAALRRHHGIHLGRIGAGPGLLDQDHALAVGLIGGNEIGRIEFDPTHGARAIFGHAADIVAGRLGEVSAIALNRVPISRASSKRRRAASISRTWAGVARARRLAARASIPRRWRNSPWGSGPCAAAPAAWAARIRAAPPSLDTRRPRSPASSRAAGDTSAAGPPRWRSLSSAKLGPGGAEANARRSPFTLTTRSYQPSGPR